jgi:DtxR family Mn-dependent transcriptional regulator
MTKQTQSVEDYLKAIYQITLYEERASTNKLASYLSVTPASVTGMLKKLSKNDPPLVEYEKHRGVALTEPGEKIALETIRHHRLLELFLHDILGYPWDEVDEEAEHLEHVISEKFEKRIASVLGDPVLDPHGHPIPKEDLTLPVVSTTRLSELKTGQSAVIARVSDSDASMLRYLGRLGLYPGTPITVIEYTELDGNLHLKIGKSDKISVLGLAITEKIFVDLAPDKNNKD